jgi:hypothetical protein
MRDFRLPRRDAVKNLVLLGCYAVISLDIVTLDMGPIFCSKQPLCSCPPSGEGRNQTTLTLQFCHVSEHVLSSHTTTCTHQHTPAAASSFFSSGDEMSKNHENHRILRVLHVHCYYQARQETLDAVWTG